jgi:hypothetical protein
VVQDETRMPIATKEDAEKIATEIVNEKTSEIISKIEDMLGGAW